MTTNDFKKILDFIGDDSGCYAILKKMYDDEKEFETILKQAKRVILINGDTYGKGKKKNFYFVTLPTVGSKKGYNGFLVHKDDLQVPSTKAGVFWITKGSVFLKMRKKIKEEHEIEKLNADTAKFLFNDEMDDVKTERQEKYDEFLHSDYWQMVREIKLQQSEHKCQVCGSKNNLNVHHNTYAHHNNEHLHLADLVVLCRDCHALFHDKLPKEPTIKKNKPNIENDNIPLL